MTEGNADAQRRKWGFSSRWWAGLATLFGLTAPFTLALAFLLGVGQAVTDGPRPGELGPRVFEVVALVVPLGLGALIASGREIRLPDEPPLAGGRAWRRGARIAFWFALPFVLVLMFAASQLRP